MQKGARSRGSQLIYLTYLVLYIGDVRVDKSTCCRVKSTIKLHVYSSIHNVGSGCGGDCRFIDIPLTMERMRGYMY